MADDDVEQALDAWIDLCLTARPEASLPPMPRREDRPVKTLMAIDLYETEGA